MKNSFIQLSFFLTSFFLLTNISYSQTFIDNQLGTNIGFNNLPNFAICNAPSEGYTMLTGGTTTACAVSIWNPNALDLSAGFTSNFSIRFSNLSTNDPTLNPPGADGICFVLQNVGTAAIGGTGGNLGYANPDILSSLAVEFDIFNNDPFVTGNFGDIAANHVAVVHNGNIHNPLDGPFPLGNGNIEDGNWHQVRVEWDPCTLDFDVFFDNAHVIDRTEDIVALYFNNDPTNVFWGFTAGKADAAADHDICIDPIQIHPSCCAGLCNERTDLTACAEEGDFGYIALFCDATFQWTFPSGSTAFEITSPGQSIVLNASEGTYHVLITYADGCTEEIEYEIVEDCCEETGCPIPANLYCSVTLGGETVLGWDPVPGACSYEVTIDPFESACGCQGGGAGAVITTTTNQISVPLSAGDCFSWTVKTICCDGSESAPSPPKCFNKFSLCFSEGLIGGGGNSSGNSNGNTNRSSVYPNPSSDKINIELNLEAEAKISIGVFDINGKQVGKVSDGFMQAGKYVKTWPISKLIGNGIYFVKIDFGNGDVEVQKMIIQK